MHKNFCPDCGHHVEDHDMYGCALVMCSGKYGCKLTKEFLIDYLKIGGK